MFNDDWMRERGFLDEEITKAEDVIKDHKDKPLVIVRTEELVSHAIERMKNTIFLRSLSSILLAL